MIPKAEEKELQPHSSTALSPSLSLHRGPMRPGTCVSHLLTEKDPCLPFESLLSSPIILPKAKAPLCYPASLSPVCAACEQQAGVEGQHTGHAGQPQAPLSLCCRRHQVGVSVRQGPGPPLAAVQQRQPCGRWGAEAQACRSMQQSQTDEQLLVHVGSTSAHRGWLAGVAV